MNPFERPERIGEPITSLVFGLPGAGTTTVLAALPRVPGHHWLEAEPWSDPGRPALADDEPLRLGNVVSVIAADSVWPILHSGVLAPEDGAPDSAGKTVADVLVAQIESASIVVLSRVDLVSQAELRRILDLVRLLNPLAARAVSIDGMLGSRLLPSPQSDLLERVRRTPDWVAELNRSGSLPTRREGLGCVVYRDPRLFHPARLADFLEREIEAVGDVLRSRGFFRLASRPGTIGSWSSAGPMVTFEPTAFDPADPETAFGEELAFFGGDLDAERLTTALNECLLSDDEFCEGPSAWVSLADPFPEWDLGDWRQGSDRGTGRRG